MENESEVGPVTLAARSRPLRPAVFVNPRQSSGWEVELNKFVGSEVQISTGDDDIEGICVAIDFGFQSIIIATPTEKILIRGSAIVSIRRKRRMNSPLKGVAHERS